MTGKPYLSSCANQSAVLGGEPPRDNAVGSAQRRFPFAALLKHMVEGDGLDDSKLPIITRCGGTAIGQLTGDVRPTLAQRRNAMAHGDPFDGAPTGGLLELVRDLIEYAYRDYLAEAVPRRCVSLIS